MGLGTAGPFANGAPRFGLKRSSLLDGSWIPLRIFTSFPPARAQVQAQSSQFLPGFTNYFSLHFVTWRKAEHSIGCHLGGKSRCLFSKSLATPDALRHSQLLYYLSPCTCTTQFNEARPAEFSQFAIVAQPIPHVFLRLGSFNANVTGSPPSTVTDAV